MASLVAIARCNNQMHALVHHADHSWETSLAGINFAQTGVMDVTDWISPDIPSICIPEDIPLIHNVSDLQEPPGINGGRHGGRLDDDSFFGRGLVLASERPVMCDHT